MGCTENLATKKKKKTTYCCFPQLEGIYGELKSSQLTGSGCTISMVSQKLPFEMDETQSSSISTMQNH